jgi:hypothetical protein
MRWAPTAPRPSRSRARSELCALSARTFTSRLRRRPGAVEAELARHPDAPRDRIEIVHAPERSRWASRPPRRSGASRTPPSSWVLKMHKQGEVDAFISAGSTGAVMAGSLMILRPLPGVDRPAIGTVLPHRAAHVLLGRRRQRRHPPPPPGPVRPSRHHLRPGPDGRERPRVGLLNIGEEPEKGTSSRWRPTALLAAPDSELRGQHRGARHHRLTSATCWSATASWATCCSSSTSRWPASSCSCSCRRCSGERIELDLSPPLPEARLHRVRGGARCWA